MKIEDAIRKYGTLIVTIPSKKMRGLAADVLVTPNGVAFADTWWNDSAGRHALHFVRGKLSGDGPWKVGDAEFSIIDHGDDLAADHNGWIAAIAGKEDDMFARSAAELDNYVKLISS